MRQFIKVLLILFLALSTVGCPYDRLIDRLKGVSYGE